MIAHLAGCFFIKVGLSDKNKINWITNISIPYEDSLHIYISAIYWSIITMITVGYGDITPKNECGSFLLSSKFHI